MASVTCLARRSIRLVHTPRRFIHQTSACHVISNLEMPAMSPTMTEGGITSWKKREGEAFIGGDVLLEIETDKATIDVEAQDDGIMGKILLQEGSKNIPVGKVIALLAEVGDDISNLEPPKEEKALPKKEPSTSSSPSPSPATLTAASSPPSSQAVSALHISHSKPLFPSVHRLLSEHNVTKPEDIKGTGVRGMLTKGDVLAYLGQASSPYGTYKESTSPAEMAKTPKKEENKPLDGAAIRRLIVSAMLQDSIAARVGPVREVIPDFDSIIADYLPKVKPVSKTLPSAPTPAKSEPDYLDGLY